MAKYEVELDSETLRETGLQIYQDLCRLQGENPEDKWITELLEMILEIEFNGQIPVGYGTNQVKKVIYTSDEGSESDAK